MEQSLFLPKKTHPIFFGSEKYQSIHPLLSAAPKAFDKSFWDKVPS